MGFHRLSEAEENLRQQSHVKFHVEFVILQHVGAFELAKNLVGMLIVSIADVLVSQLIEELLLGR